MQKFISNFATPRSCRSLLSCSRVKFSTENEQCPSGKAKDYAKPVPSTKRFTYERFPDDKNPLTGETDGPRGPEPTRYGDWERKGRVSDF